MARYLVTGPFTYRDTGGLVRYIAPGTGVHTNENIFDTASPALSVPVGWTPPPTGLEPLDTAAKTAIDLARAPYIHGSTPGVGTQLVSSPILTF